MDLFSGTWSVAKGFRLFKKHRRFIACKVDLSCVTKTMQQIFVIYARQVLRKKTSKAVNEEVHNSVKEYVRTV